MTRNEIVQLRERASLLHTSPGLQVCLPAALLLELLDALDAAERERDEVEALRGALEWVRQTVHRAHHEGPLDGCPNNTCHAARAALARTKGARP